MNAPCTYSPDNWINFCDYTPTQIILILIGTILWNFAYGIIIYNSIRYRYVEMPYLAGASNIAWELAWGYLVVSDMGKLFVWGLRIWLYMDILIFVLLLCYGAKQFEKDQVKPYFRLIFVSVFLCWIPIFYFFYKEGYDTPMGATSAYLITVIMGALYIHHFLNRSTVSYFSPWVGWFELIGNTTMSVFVWLKYPEMRFLQLLALAVFFLNLVYVLLHYKHPRIKRKDVPSYLPFNRQLA